jgi:oligopeptide transport system substrate-binding protein
MNYLAKPFDNIAIRQAFALALDKSTLAAVSQSTPTNSLLGSWQGRAEQIPIGPATSQAQGDLAQGLSQEGLSNVSQLPPITFSYQAGQPELTSEVKLAQQMWKTSLGITVKLQPRANLNQAIAATRGNASLQFWAADYTPSFLDPYALVGLPFAQNSPLNTVNYGQNSSAGAAQQQALQSSLSPAQHMGYDQLTLLQVYQYADQALTSEAAWVPISLVVHLYFIAQAFSNPDFSQPFSNAWSPWGSEDYCASSPPC